VPLFVDVTIDHTSPGETKLCASVETNQQLKMPLENIKITAFLVPGVECCQPSPTGTWDAAQRQMIWRIPQLLSREKPVVCEAQFLGDSTGGSAKEDDVWCAVRQQPIQVKFSCEGVTISGIELEVQTSGAGKPVAKLTRRFQAGDYKVQWGE